MRIIITQTGWAGYTGTLGYSEFVDGISVEDLGRGEIQAIAANVTVEEYKDGAGTGKNPSIAQVIIDTTTMPAPVVESSVRADGEPAPELPAKIYTPEELAELADKGGIKGLRAIAEPRGITGKGIAELIGKILSGQKDATDKAEQAARDAAPAPAADAGAADDKAGK